MTHLYNMITTSSGLSTAPHTFKEVHWSYEQIYVVTQWETIYLWANLVGYTKLPGDDGMMLWAPACCMGWFTSNQINLQAHFCWYFSKKPAIRGIWDASGDVVCHVCQARSAQNVPKSFSALRFGQSVWLGLGLPGKVSHWLEGRRNGFLQLFLKKHSINL